MTNPLSLFQKPNKPVYLKMGLYGDTGSGKTYLAGQMAIGIVKDQKKDKPVLMFDTETGSDYLIPMFEKAGVELLVVKSRSFSKLLEATAQAEKIGSVLIIDSVQHIWEELIAAYKKKKGRQYVQINEWAEIKQYWGTFTKAYLNLNLDAILSGRAVDITENYTEESGQKGFEKVGERMGGEKFMAYEPSLLIRMEKVEDVRKQTLKHMAFIEKDRTDHLTGKLIEEPNFESFRQVWDSYSHAGPSIGIDNDTSLDHIENRHYDLEDLKRRRAIACEEIQNAITKYIPGRAAADQKAKVEIMEKVYGTAAWTRYTDFGKQSIPIDTLEKGISDVVALSQTYAIGEVPTEDAKAEFKPSTKIKKGDKK